ncbi:RNA dependent RNA polymerase [Naegleria gruberi]|uniref:RNA-dependent RNA polymerase n=1 Tax=Naegleria gruberi TaxID=5762 RepID=D2VAG1_NAEGR|nr:RNA dependent RNA polymerase [Naegleria gruberi]EFC46423.1 RNA dependent RNA polymerase [Naegleria gruberi]|eukprot:XP_002679167.1 RNA dependent RNA polymerase [Naegleria gruberi strain NEG-M]
MPFKQNDSNNQTTANSSTEQLIDNLFYCYHLSRNKTLPLIRNEHDAGICLARLSHLRGEGYSGMSFDQRFELMKKVSKKVIVTYPEGLESINNWFLEGKDDKSYSDGRAGLKLSRMRSITFYSFIAAEKAELCVIFKSSPKDNFVIGRFRQEFGGDCILNVSFIFSRMGLKSQRMVRDEQMNGSILNPFSFEEIDFFFLLTKMKILKQDTDIINDVFDKEYIKKLKHQSRFRNELITWKKAFKDNINPLPFKFGKYQFNILCQNTSGMHSYKYVYCCPQLANTQDPTRKLSTVEQIKEWAIPKELNPTLYDSKNILKQRIRLALYNTPVIPTEIIQYFTVIPDIERDGFNFTDGCGFISPDMAKKVYKHILNAENRVLIKTDQEEDEIGYDEQRGFDLFSDSSYIPSAFQIRFRGAKGMLVVNTETFEKYRVHIVLRESMVKCKTNEKVDQSFSTLQIVGHSSPCELTRVNSTIMHLLSGCDSNGEVRKRVLEMASAHVQNSLDKYVHEDTEVIARQYMKDNNLISLNVLSTTKNKGFAFLAGPYKSLITSLKIPFSNSRRLYGVVDPYEVLNEGEVFVQISSFKNPSHKQVLQKEIVLTKEPCLHRGDLRKIKAVYYPKLSHLCDVIVFSSKGKRPVPNMISGSDLDGDQFFVCWDDLIVDNVKIFEPGLFDEEIKQEDIRPFEPDVFKDWVGVRHAYVDHHGSNWTNDENWNKEMRRLCEIVNHAVGSPKNGVISVATREEDLRFIDNFPGYPHYHQSKRGALKKSSSLASEVYQQMVDCITKTLELKEHNIRISVQNDKDHILESIRLEIFDLLLANTSNNFGEKIMKKISEFIGRALTIKHRAQFLAEFFNLMYEFFTIQSKELVLFNLKTTIQNLSESGMKTAIESVISNKHVLFISGFDETQFTNRELVPKKLKIDFSCSVYEINSEMPNYEEFLKQELFCAAQEGLQLELGINLLFGKTLITVLQEVKQVRNKILFDPKACFDFGKSKVLSNERFGLKLIELAARYDYGPALNYLGELYEIGSVEIGYEKDLKKALSLFERSSLHNNDEAFMKLGDYYYFNSNGDPIPYYTKGAELGNIYCMTKLSTIYFDSDNLQKSFQYSLQAALIGDSNSMKNVAISYMHGEGVDQDDALFLYWINKAIEMQVKDSMTILADFHAFKNDFKEAFVWYTRALEFDDSDIDAKQKLGVIYMYGLDIEQNYAKGSKMINETGGNLEEVLSNFRIFLQK